MPTKVSISLRAQFRQKWCSFVAWLAENRFAAAYAWWIELVELLRSRCNSVAAWSTIPTSALLAPR
jgi:hypothetical protein